MCCAIDRFVHYTRGGSFDFGPLIVKINLSISLFEYPNGVYKIRSFSRRQFC